ncbi:crotonobetaine/carnitine-CoA ligase [Tamaricihabitans halophyticus]|uniref:Crotonobetaine/carnitine-CoA ligase n=1 Tax=Tamaricihabitans halophyticus TaxID=1262583 RepID=A0A4R2QIB9_9PSEU|nr:AMP-binding protein [Tamaricihabitans halophyticus]TCP48519.1 crotonobetaine/carnitine-CoA ligase [Tamaricihabitans halophyticus]
MDWWSAEVPEAEECVLGPLLHRAAGDRPEEVHAVFADGTQWTNGYAWQAANALARELQARGVGPGDRVLSWFPNGPDALRVWYGANLLGAIYVPLNPAYRGRLLEHVISLSGARIMIAHPALAAELQDVDAAHVEQVVALAADQWTDVDGDAVTPDRPVQPWDPYAIIFTSGTTGPSKGVICSYAQLATAASAAFTEYFGTGDRYMVNLPLFHAGGTVGTYAALLLGGSIAVVDRFDTNQFWHTVRATGTTHVTLLGVMANFLSKQQPDPRDRDHPLRHVYMVPLIDDAHGFAARFGVDFVAMFNMTETAIPIISELNPRTPGTCGRLRYGMQARIVDEHDREVADGASGELILRADRPWSMNSGYWNMPEATAHAWRNGWYHTGDSFRKQDGEYFFHDRVKDAIRRRGENVSSFDVESEILAHPNVREAAVVAVPSPHGEDDILAVIAPNAGKSITPKELVAFLAERMAYFMVPRYVRILAELPKTPTSKVEKHHLRATGVTADTWDRERNGITLKRRDLQSPM